MSTKRVEWIDVLKGMLILCVVLGHAIQECLKVHGIAFEENFWRNLIYSFHMPAFMAVSGYLSYRVKFKEPTWNDLIKKSIDKFKRLMIPFFMWSVLLYVVYANVDSFLEYIYYPNLGLWFLWALFFILLIQMFISKIGGLLKVNVDVLIVMVGVLLVSIQFFIAEPKFLGYEYIAFYYIYYFVGYFINKWSAMLPKSWFYVLVLATLWFIGACYWTPNSLPVFLVFLKGIIPEFVLKMGYRMLIPLIFVLSMFTLASRLTLNECIRSFLAKLGMISLGVYTSHMVVKKLFAEIVCDAVPAGVYVQVIILFLCLVAFSLIIVNMLLRFNLTARLFLGVTKI